MNEFRRVEPPPPWVSGLVYALGMTVAVISGSAFVIGGMVGGASGWSALVLAAAIPLAGLTWALTLSILHRGDARHRPVPGAESALARPNSEQESSSVN